MPRFVTIILFSYLLASPASSETLRQLDAHNHGEAQLSIVTDNQQMAITLTTPSANVIGFEHEPRTDEQRAQVGSVKKILADYNKLFRLENRTGMRTS